MADIALPKAGAVPHYKAIMILRNTSQGNNKTAYQGPGYLLHKTYAQNLNAAMVFRIDSEQGEHFHIFLIAFSFLFVMI
jgi:hypothetical protein